MIVDLQPYPADEGPRCREAEGGASATDRRGDACVAPTTTSVRAAETFSWCNRWFIQIRCDETDPDRLHDLQADLDAAEVYTPAQIDDFVERYLGDAERDRLDPLLDARGAGS